MKLSDKARQIIAAVAPTLGTALGGPFGALAGATIAKALGGDPNVPAETEAALEAQSPETLLALKKANQDFEIRLNELGIEKERLVFDDRKDARARDAKLGGDATTKALAYVVIGAFVAMAFSVLYGWAVAESTLMGTIIGYMSAKAEQVISYYFGSSMGSKHKTDALAEKTK